MIKNWILYLIILFPVSLFSQQPREFISKKDSLLPGTSTSISFTIENNTSNNKTYIVTTETSDERILPILTKGEITIPANGNSVYIVPLRIATETPQGTYTVILHITDKNNEEKSVRSTDISILGTHRLSLTALDSPEFIKAGEAIKASFLIKNNGNIIERLALESKNATVSQDSTLILPPSEAKIITITKNTNPGLGKNEYQNLNLSVHSIDNLEENQTVYTSVKVISVNPVEDDIYHRIPVAASLSFIGMRNRGNFNDGFQGEIYGKGSLDKENKGLLEFHAVTANPVEFSSFTQYEEYFINYKRDNFLIHLGDKTYSSSYITEFARYGRGAELRFDLKNMSFGGFYNHPRFFHETKDEFNLYSKFKLAKESEITAGYLYKIPNSENDPGISNITLDSNAHLPYLTGKFKISKNLNLRSEVSYSKTNQTEGTAYMIQAEGNFEKINGNIMYMKASPQFAGYFTNTNTFNGSLQYKISNKINLLANYTQDARNFQRDTLFLTAPYRRFLQYGIQYHYIKNGSFTFYNGYQRYEDRLEPKEFNYSEKFLKINIDQQIGIFQLNLEGQFGKTNNYLTEFTGNSSFYTLNVGFEKFKTSFNVYGSYALTSRYQLQNQKQLYYGARIISRFSDQSYLSLFYQNNYLPEEYFKDRNLFELLFHQQLFPGHELDLSGRYTLQRGQLGDKDFIFSLRYTLRLNIPVQKIAEYTTLSGNINNLGVKKVDGIRLILGNHLAITDNNGNFIFKNIKPGEYFFEIDRSTTEINDIPDINLPTTINLFHKESVFNFGLTNAAKIQGHIQFTENQLSFAQFQLNKEKKKKESVIIEATNGEQTYRKIVVLNDSFDFTYLRPGNWSVKIYRNGLDKHYKIPIDTFNFILKPSETKHLIINISKQQTEVKYQQETLKVGYNEIKKRE